VLRWRIHNGRYDTLHKVTTKLARTKSVVVVEDLNVSGMMKNHSVAGAVAGAGLYEFRRQIEYKGRWYGCQVVVADRFFPSSKTCSACGLVHGGLRLSDRKWSCPECGCVHDRDFNAAVNLENWGVNALLAASSTESLNACGEGGSDYDSGRSEPTSAKQELRRDVA